MNRKVLNVIISLLIVSGSMLTNVWAGDTAGSGKAYDWYCNPTKDHSQPQAIPEASFLSNYDVYYIGNKEEKTLYLTFDAGFDNGYHDSILKTLQKHNIPAAFFVDGGFLRLNPELGKRIVSEGHILANHTLTHSDLTKKSDLEAYKRELLGWEDLARKATGSEPVKFLRPPAGRFSERTLQYDRELGYKTIFWSFAYADWNREKQPSHELAKEKIYGRIHNGCVLLLHSTSKTNAEVLDEVITKLRGEGYTFKDLYHLTSQKQ